MIKKCYEVSFYTDTIEVEADSAREASKKARQLLTRRLYPRTQLVFVDVEEKSRYYGYSSIKEIKDSIIRDNDES